MFVLPKRRTENGRFHRALWALVIGGGILLNSESPCSGEPVLSCISGNCEACHAPGGETLMLRRADPSSTCLLCHEAPQSAFQPQGHFNATSQAVLNATLAPTQLTPAGDYGWLKRNFSWVGEDEKMERSPGERHGHNIVAADYSYSADTTLRVAPGGTYPASSLSCISCHDPHGNYRRSADGTISPTGLPIIASGSYNTSPNPDASGSVRSYRMLAGNGYLPKSLPGTPFTADPPAAVAPSTYNRSESASETRVAYGSGMSEWCQNCHSQIHNGINTAGIGHPAGNNARFSARTMEVYNSYLKSADLSGVASNSYTSMVPFEMGTNDYALLKSTANSDGSNLAGPGTAGDTPNVMCLSCHRAHASGWDSMTRWNMNSTMLVYKSRYPGIDNGAPARYAQGRTETEVRKTFYDRPAGRYAGHQRSLCSKCHARD